MNLDEQITKWGRKRLQLKREFMKAHNARRDAEAWRISADLEKVERHIERLKDAQR